MNKLLIVGTMAFDTIETPFGKVEKVLGGAATYIGLSASYFNLNSAIVSVVGEDFDEKYMQYLSDKNINLLGVQKIKGAKSFFWSGRYHTNMNDRDTLQTELNVLADFKPIVPEEYKNSEVVLLGNLHPAIQLDVLNQMNQKPKMVILDTMNFWINGNLQELKEVIKKVDILSINDEEARLLSGEYSLAKASKKIQEMGVNNVIIKKGENGALFFAKEGTFFAPAIPLDNITDPTGAGDSFAGGVAGYLAKTGDFTFNGIKNAIVYGSALASFCVEMFGTEKMQNLSTQEVDNRINEFKELSQFNM